MDDKLIMILGDQQCSLSLNGVMNEQHEIEMIVMAYKTLKESVNLEARKRIDEQRRKLPAWF